VRLSWIASISLVALFVASGCAPDRVVTAPTPSPTPPAASSTEASPEAATEAPPEAAPASAIAWLDTPLTNTVTGKEFRLSDYKGKTVLLHPFAAW
jgi:hypothetical protein